MRVGIFQSGFLWDNNSRPENIKRGNQGILI